MTTKRTRRPRRSWGKIKLLPRKRYRASYVAPDLTRHAAPVTFTARMDAEHWLADERRLIERGVWTPPSLRAAAGHAKARTLHAYASEWIAGRNLKPRTRHGYEELLAKPLKPLHAVPVGLLSPEVVRRWHGALDKSTPRRNEHAYGLLHAVLATAVGDGLLSANPANVRGAMSSASKREAIVLTPNEIAKVALSIRPAQLKAAVLILAWCGLRWSQLIEPRRKDIDLDAEVIRKGLVPRVVSQSSAVVSSTWTAARRRV